jgi:hypothetical protein
MSDTAWTFRLDPPATLWVGDVALGWAEITTADQNRPQTAHIRTALLRFDNGWSVAFRWSTGTCSSNAIYDDFIDNPATVEVALIEPGGGLHRGTVSGFVGVNAALRLVQRVWAFRGNQPPADFVWPLP